MRCTTWLVIAAMLAAVGHAVQAQELVLNGDFESPSAGNANQPAGFTPGQAGKSRQATLTWESPGCHSAKCIAVETATSDDLGYWQTVLPVKPETTYRFSLQYRTRQPHAAPAPTGDPLYNEGSPGGPNIEFGMSPEDPAKAARPADWSDMPVALSPLGGIYLPPAVQWSRFDHLLTTRPGQTDLIVKLRIFCYAQKAWFDHLSLKESGDVADIAPPRLRAGQWVAQDTTPPCASDPRPVPNARVDSCAVIRAGFRDSGSGIDVKSVQVLLDNQEVTDRATISDEGFSLSPATPFENGVHRVEVMVADQAGNRGNRLTWRFGVGRQPAHRPSVREKSLRLDGEPFFPIGIYAYACHPADGRFHREDLRQAADAGFNFVLNTIETADGLDQEQAAGMMGVLNVTADIKKCVDPVSARKALFEDGQGRFRDHPAVLGYWADDPEHLPDHLTVMKHAQAAIQEMDAAKPIIFAISDLPKLAECIPYADILVSYRYPVPHYHPQMIHGSSLAVFYRQVQDKPIWFLSQAIDLGYAPSFQSMEKFRPTPAEIRAMAFYSLVLGIQGYALYANLLNPRDYPDEWSEALRIATQIRHLSGPLASGRIEPGAVLRPAVSAAAIKVRHLVLDGLHTLIAVNLSAAHVAAVWEFPAGAQAVALFEDRAMPAKANHVEDVFAPWQVHVYQWWSDDQARSQRTGNAR